MMERDLATVELGLYLYEDVRLRGYGQGSSVWRGTRGSISRAC